MGKRQHSRLASGIKRLLERDVKPNMNPLGNVAKAIEAVHKHKISIIFRPTEMRMFKDTGATSHSLTIYQELYASLPSSRQKVAFLECFVYYAKELASSPEGIFSVARELGHILLHYEKAASNSRCVSKITPRIFYLLFTRKQRSEADTFARAVIQGYLGQSKEEIGTGLPTSFPQNIYTAKAGMSNTEDLKDLGWRLPKVNLSELPLLASRDAAVIGKYGERRVEKIFEAQLALLVQSLGFYVVPTRVGQRTVDLICISEHPDKSFTFLLEAKTTRQSYSLPTKDERAISDYVKDMRSHIAPLPPVRLVLIVGHKASKTLEHKLMMLQGRVQVPVRFCSARTLVTLRSGILGAVSVADFLKAISSQPLVMSERFAENIIASYRKKSDAVINLMKMSMF